MSRLLSLILICFTINDTRANEDPQTGLIMDAGWELVRANCGGCHSYDIITSQKSDRQGWEEMIRWMQSSQNLWQFDPKTEETILDYLTKSYPPSESRRRAPITKTLMPLN
jgi:mono/diheme cytochrome c family protein